MKLIFALLAIAIAFPALADQYVKPHYRKDGTYVQGHYRSSPNAHKFDNFSSKGNTNPYTGERGTQRHEFSNPSIYDAPKLRSIYD